MALNSNQNRNKKNTGTGRASSGTARKSAGTTGKASSRSSSSPRKKRAKKPKVVLSSKKVYVMTASIFFICTFFLYLSVTLNKPSKNIAAEKTSPVNKVQQAEKIEPKKNAPSAVAKTAPAAKTVSPAVTKTPVKQAPKASEKAVSNSTLSKSTAAPAVQAPVKTVTSSVNTASSNSPDTANSVKKSSPVQTPSVQTSSDTLVAKVIPPKQEEQVQEQVLKSPFDIPQAQNGATIVIIIDDAGRSAANTKLYAQLPFPLTIAVLPKQSQTKQCAQAVLAGGKEMILHQPMQAENLGIDPGPGAIKANMSSWEIAAVVKENLDELGKGVKGLNNHEGSLITANEIKIGTVLDVCAERGVYFLDSRTTAATKAKQAALERDMNIFEKAGPYIDNDLTRSKMLERMYETLAYANRHGRAIVIGHVDKSAGILPQLLTEMYPYMKKAGYRFATPSMLK